MRELINKLGNSFRGLWTGIIVQDSFGNITKKKDWTVTFVFDGDYVETPGFDEPEKALQFAIDFLKNNEVKICSTMLFTESMPTPNPDPIPDGQETPMP